MEGKQKQVEDSFIQWLNSEYPYNSKMIEAEIDELRVAYINQKMAIKNFQTSRQTYIDVNNAYNNSKESIDFKNDFERAERYYSIASSYLDECNLLMSTLKERFDKLYSFDRSQEKVNISYDSVPKKH